MKINGLTRAQIQMCNRVWDCKELKDFKQLCDSLNEKDRLMAITLMEIMLQETYEEELEKMESYPDAEKLLKNISLSE